MGAVMQDLSVAGLLAQLDRHVAYLDELGERAQAFQTAWWDLERGAWRDLERPDGQVVPAP